jgi:hypothetical protein
MTRVHDPSFFAVPGIDSRELSTSFKVRGRDLRVDFLTPAVGSRATSKPIYLPHLRVAAQPLQGLDYVIQRSVDAAVIAGAEFESTFPLRHDSLSISCGSLAYVRPRKQRRQKRTSVRRHKSSKFYSMIVRVISAQRGRNWFDEGRCCAA